MKKRLILIGSSLLIIGGAVLVTGRIQDYLRTRHTASANAAHAFDNHATGPAPVQRIEGNPTAISIPSLNINLVVAPGYYNTRSKTWTLSLDKAHFATITPEPNNQEGNTFIYGHNRKQVFSTLNKIQPGALVTLKTDNNHTFTYKYVSSYETNPNDDRLFTYKGAPILTLQTCSGLWYQNRQLFRFDLVSVA